MVALSFAQAVLAHHVCWAWDADSPWAATHFLPHSWGNNWAFVVLPIFGRNSPELSDWGRSGRNGSVGNLSCQWELCDPPLWHKTCMSWCSLLSLKIIKTILAFFSLPSYCFRCCTVWDRSFCLFMQRSYLSLPASVSCSWFLTSPPAFCFPPNASSTLSSLSSPFYTSWASSSSCSSYL